jgi:hypothetical protein
LLDEDELLIHELLDTELGEFAAEAGVLYAAEG